MPSDPASVLRDMQHHDLAIQFVAGLDYKAFQNDTRTLYAVTRCLEIISEASRRLPAEMKARYLRLPGRTWPGLATSTGMTTSVAAKLVWDTVQLALLPLRAVVARELAALE